MFRPSHVTAPTMGKKKKTITPAVAPGPPPAGGAPLRAADFSPAAEAQDEPPEPAIPVAPPAPVPVAPVPPIPAAPIVPGLDDAARARADKFAWLQPPGWTHVPINPDLRDGYRTSVSEAILVRYEDIWERALIGNDAPDYRRIRRLFDQDEDNADASSRVYAMDRLGNITYMLLSNGEELARAVRQIDEYFHDEEDTAYDEQRYELSTPRFDAATFIALIDSGHFNMGRYNDADKAAIRALRSAMDRPEYDMEVQYHPIFFGNRKVVDPGTGFEVDKMDERTGRPERFNYFKERDSIYSEQLRLDVEVYADISDDIGYCDRWEYALRVLWSEIEAADTARLDDVHYLIDELYARTVYNFDTYAAEWSEWQPGTRLRNMFDWAYPWFTERGKKVRYERMGMEIKQEARRTLRTWEFNGTLLKHHRYRELGYFELEARKVYTAARVQNRFRDAVAGSRDSLNFMLQFAEMLHIMGIATDEHVRQGILERSYWERNTTEALKWDLMDEDDLWKIDTMLERLSGPEEMGNEPGPPIESLEQDVGTGTKWKELRKKNKTAILKLFETMDDVSDAQLTKLQEQSAEARDLLALIKDARPKKKSMSDEELDKLYDMEIEYRELTPWLDSERRSKAIAADRADDRRDLQREYDLKVLIATGFKRNPKTGEFTDTWTDSVTKKVYQRGDPAMELEKDRRHAGIPNKYWYANPPVRFMEPGDPRRLEKGGIIFKDGPKQQPGQSSEEWLRLFKQWEETSAKKKERDDKEAVLQQRKRDYEEDQKPYKRGQQVVIYLADGKTRWAPKTPQELKNYYDRIKREKEQRMAEARQEAEARNRAAREQTRKEWEANAPAREAERLKEERRRESLIAWRELYESGEAIPWEQRQQQSDVVNPLLADPAAYANLP